MSHCTRCDGVELEPGVGALGEDVCPSCDGRFVAEAIAADVLRRYAGIEVALVRELVAHFAGERLTCPGCRFAMSPVTLRGAASDFCLGCGGLWFDGGELAVLTKGQVAEVGGDVKRDMVPSSGAADLLGTDEQVGKLREMIHEAELRLRLLPDDAPLRPRLQQRLDELVQRLFERRRRVTGPPAQRVTREALAPRSLRCSLSARPARPSARARAKPWPATAGRPTSDTAAGSVRWPG